MRNIVTNIEDITMIIAVADLHLGSHMANKSGFINFIHEFLIPNQKDISRIVLLGDVLDLWRNKNSQVLRENLDVLEELAKLDVKKNYLVGNHDYAILSLLGKDNSSVPPDSRGVLDQVSETLELEYDGLKLKFIHGHQVDYWPALEFYEIFSQAMCFVDINDPELSDVWNIIHRFAEVLPEGIRNKVRNLPGEIRSALEKKLAGPLDGNEEEKKSLLHEWELLLSVSDFEDVANRSGKMLSEIIELSRVWEQILRVLDQHLGSSTLPPQLEYDVHQMRRDAAAINVNLQEDEFLVRGHGHTPYVNKKQKVADAGCWLGNRGSYLRVEDGQVTTHHWQENA